MVEPSGRLLDGRTLGVDLEWRCAHETAATILDRIAARAERTGDLPLATAARALTLTLPLEDDSRDYRVRDHARLLSPPELGRADLAAPIRTEADRQRQHQPQHHRRAELRPLVGGRARGRSSASVVRVVSSHCAASLRNGIEPSAAQPSGSAK